MPAFCMRRTPRLFCRQLAPDRPSHDVISHFPGIRWQQTHGYGYVPNPAMEAVFMVVTMDLPDFNSPHGT